MAVLDTIVCGNVEKDTIKTLVRGVSEACRENECSLVGGETSIQPSVVDAGVYVLISSIAGIVEKSKDCGVGFNIVVSQREKAAVMKHVSRFYPCYEIGKIKKGAFMN